MGDDSNRTQILAENELQALLSIEQLADVDRQEILKVVCGEDTLQLDDGLTQEKGVESIAPVMTLEGANTGPSAPRAGAVAKDDSLTLLSTMPVAAKIKLAMFGNATVRAFLIRDSSKLVQAFVLKNPRIQVREIEEFARNTNLSEQVLRGISGNQAWTKSYAVKANLVFNPKTPSDLALKWVRYLNVAEIRRLAKSRNVPQVLVNFARKKLEESTR